MKKLLLGLGTLAAIVAPITTVVACGTGQDHNDGGTQGPSNLDSRSWNHGAIETSVDDEQMTGNGFVSTEATQQSRDATIEAANSITKAQIEALINISPDSTEFPTQVTNLPQSLQVTASNNTNITAILTWTPNDINGSLTWRALISDRTEAQLTGTFSGFKSIEAANSITKAQIEALININPDSTEFPTQVRNLPQSFLVRASNNIDVLATLTWTPNDIDGSLTWRALISDRTEPTPFGTILGFKDATTANKEIEVATANSITKAQIEANIHMYVSSDLTKLPSKVTNLPQSLQVIANNNTKVAATLTWTPNDIDGSLTWTATISDRTKATLTGTISGFKSIEATNSITKAQIEALIHVSSDTTKLPSEVMNLPQSLQVIANNNTKVDVTLTWTPNDIDGSLTWTAAISDRTEDAPTGTISGFKDKATADREAIIEAANLITYAQLVDLIGGNSDPTKLPSEIIGLPTTINVVPATDSSASVIVSLTWTQNDINGSLMWKALISDRTEPAPFGAISGFKDASIANKEITIEAANSITKAQIEALININPDSTEFPTQVRNLPQSFLVRASNNIDVLATLTWTPNDIDGSLTWRALISDRTEAILTGTILGFKDVATANANSITKAQIESLIHVSADSTEFPTQVRNLPQLLQVTTSDGINIDVTLTWTPNDIDGSLTWTVTISDRTEPAPFGTILGFKDATTANK